MYTPAQTLVLPDVLIGTIDERHGAGSDMRLIGTSTSVASVAWGTANRALYMPLYIDRPVVVTKFWTYNGATAAGNVDIGLYDRNYNRLVSTGAIAQSGTSVLQEYDVTDFTIAVGVYFLGLANSTTTATFFSASSNVAGFFGAMGMTQQASALPLPNPATPAQITAVAIPACGIAVRTLVA